MKLKILILIFLLNNNIIFSKPEFSEIQKFYQNEVETKGPYAILF